MAVLDIEVVDIRKNVENSNLKAYADLKIGGNMIVKGFSVMEGKRGTFVSMPRRLGKDGKWADIVTPTNQDFKQDIEEKVLKAYDVEVGRA